MSEVHRWGGRRRPPWSEGDGRPPWSEGHPRPPWRGRRPGRPRLFLPVVLTVAQIVGARLAAHSQPEARDLDALAYSLLAIGPVSLVARGRLRAVGLAVALAATVAYALLEYPSGPFFLAAFVSLFGVVRAGQRWTAWILAALAYAAYLGLGPLLGSVGDTDLRTPDPVDAIAVAAWTAVVLMLAEAARVRSAHFAEMARARAEAERARSEQSRRQASEERLRIAQELHDVLGHHLSLINLRAGVALHLLDSQPEQAREAFAAIKQASAEALAEVRAVLSTLYPEESAPRSPAPGLSDLDSLVEQARAAGLPVAVRTVGEPAPLPPDVDRAAYRIVREALTNVRRHAGPSAQALVTLGWSEGSLLVRVDDDGSGPSTVETDAAGNGIPGMRERAAALGGTLSTGPAPGHGFRVEARLPRSSPSEPAGDGADRTDRADRADRAGEECS